MAEAAATHFRKVVFSAVANRVPACLCGSTCRAFNGPPWMPHPVCRNSVLGNPCFRWQAGIWLTKPLAQP